MGVEKIDPLIAPNIIGGIATAMETLIPKELQFMVNCIGHSKDCVFTGESIPWSRAGRHEWPVPTRWATWRQVVSWYCICA